MTTLRERMEELPTEMFYGHGLRLYIRKAAVDEITADGDATIAALTGDVLYWGRQLSAAMERAESAEAEVARLSAPVESLRALSFPILSRLQSGTEEVVRLDDAESTIRALQARLDAADAQLPRVLHELAGSASMCWEPKPAGVFAASHAIEFCSSAIDELRAILRGDFARTASTANKGPQ